MLKLFFVVAILATCMSCYSAGELGFARTLDAARAESSHVPIDEIVLDALGRDGRTGSLVYRGYCGPSGVIHYPFKPAPSHDTASSLQALREILASDPKLVVEEDSRGLTRISSTDVAHDLLDLKISHFSFNGEYDPADAVDNILRTAEVTTFMKDHHIHFEPKTGRIGIEPGKNLPQLKGRMENVSVSQALDRILQTFPGLWIYKECVQSDGKRFVDFEFQFIRPKNDANSNGALRQRSGLTQNEDMHQGTGTEGQCWGRHKCIA